MLGREEDDACAPCAARAAALVGLRVREEEEAVAAAVDDREVDTERSARQRGKWQLVKFGFVWVILASFLRLVAMLQVNRSLKCLNDCEISKGAILGT